MNKKKITKLLLVAAAVSASSHILGEEAKAVQQSNDVSVQAVSQSKGKVINVSTNLRIRKAADINAEVIGYLVNGQEFNIKGRSGDWYNIEVNGLVGYVHKDYVKESSTTTVTNPTSGDGGTTLSKGQVVNVSSALNIRSGASTSYQIIGTLKNGQVLSLKGKSGDWYSIDVSGKTGYVHKDYVKELIDNSSTIPTTPETPTTPTPTETINKKGQVINVSSSLRIRKEASTSSAIVGYLINGQSITITGQSGDWYSINSNGVTGYVYKEYIKLVDGNSTTTPTKPSETLEEIGIVVNVTSNLRLRNKPTSDYTSSVIGYLLPGDSFKILGTSGDWININYNGKVGYVLKDYVKKVEALSNEDISKTYTAILNILKAQIGAPYVYGGAGELLTTSFLNELKVRFPSAAQSGEYNLAQQYVDRGYRSFDCSGFLYWGFKQVGINIGRTTYDQINNGIEVSKENVKPGDFLFYSDISHVGMYIGNNQWIESSNSKSYVKIADVPWSKIGRIRRILN